MSKFRSEQIDQPINLTGTFTGDLIGTASYATFAANGGGGSVDTSSLLTTASFNSYTSSTTSQFAGTASFATTASFALNAGGAGFPFTGNAVITGSLIVSGSSSGLSGITGSLQGTASFATTASHALNGGVTSIVAGTGISRSSATGSVTITNTAPDQVVSLTNGGSISITGTYPSFTIQNTAPFPGFGYSQLLYIFSQVGGNAPSTNGGPIINTTGLNYTFKRNGIGEYELAATSDTPFTANLTAVYLTPGYTVGTFGNSNVYSVWFEIASTSIINIYSYDVKADGPTDDVFNQATLDIKILA